LLASPAFPKQGNKKEKNKKLPKERQKTLIPPYTPKVIASNPKVTAAIPIKIRNF